MGTRVNDHSSSESSAQRRNNERTTPPTSISTMFVQETRTEVIADNTRAPIIHSVLHEDSRVGTTSASTSHLASHKDPRVVITDSSNANSSQIAAVFTKPVATTSTSALVDEKLENVNASSASTNLINSIKTPRDAVRSNFNEAIKTSNLQSGGRVEAGDSKYKVSDTKLQGGVIDNAKDLKSTLKPNEDKHAGNSEELASDSKVRGDRRDVQGKFNEITSSSGHCEEEGDVVPDEDKSLDIRSKSMQETKPMFRIPSKITSSFLHSIKSKYIPLPPEPSGTIVENMLPEILAERPRILNFSDLKELKRLGVSSLYEGSYFGTAVVVKIVTVKNMDMDEIQCYLNAFRIPRHPNIVLYFGMCADEKGDLCLVTEFMEGGSLNDVLHNPAIELSWQKHLLKIAKDICRGVFYLHKQQVIQINGRLKSSNVCLGKSFGNTKITYFGRLDDAADEFKWWLPPSVRCGQELMDEKSDVYSFGLLLWEMCTRRSPYDGQSMALEHNIAEDLVFPVEAMPKSIYNLFKKCISSNPQNRPDFGSLLKELEAEVEVEVDKFGPFPVHMS